VVVPRPGRQVDVEELLGFLRGELADFKVPEYVVVLGEALPRNPGGKIVKPKLREEVDWSQEKVARGRFKR